MHLTGLLISSHHFAQATVQVKVEYFAQKLRKKVHATKQRELEEQAKKRERLREEKLRVQEIALMQAEEARDARRDRR